LSKNTSFVEVLFKEGLDKLLMDVASLGLQTRLRRRGKDNNGTKKNNDTKLTAIC